MTTIDIDWRSLSAEEKIALVKPLYEAGNSCGQIADMFMGVTRNMIIGCIHRSNAIKKRPRKPPVKKPIVPPAPKPKPAVARKPLPAQPGTPPIIQVLPEPDMPSERVWHMINNNRPPLAGIAPTALIDLPTREGVVCRFPVVGGYCGAASGDAMYCKTHHAIMYRPETQKLRVPKEARL